MGLKIVMVKKARYELPDGPALPCLRVKLTCGGTNNVVRYPGDDRDSVHTHCPAVCAEYNGCSRDCSGIWQLLESLVLQSLR